jgi:phosphohistidine phosphatase
MKLLGTFRHGPATPRDPLKEPDALRTLTPDGRRLTRAAAHGVLSLEHDWSGLWTSPLPRARETAEILALALGLKRPRVASVLAPDSRPEDILAFAGRHRAPLLVGHEPSLSKAVLQACGAPHGNLKLRKAGLAVVKFDFGLGTLVSLLDPHQLRRLGRA